MSAKRKLAVRGTLMDESLYKEIKKLHIVLKENREGQDYFVGDIHGKYTDLMERLRCLDFDFEKDRLVSVGDIINRGDESEKLLHLLSENWFFAVQGNHEHMFLNCLTDEKRRPFFYSVGGTWLKKWIDNPESIKIFKNQIIDKMPMFITVESKEGNIGVSHADAPKDWQSVIDKSLNEETLALCQWRRIGDVKPRKKINSVDACVHGHTAVKKVKCINNQVWIDTYYLSNEMTILSAAQVMKKVKSKWFNF